MTDFLIICCFWKFHENIVHISPTLSKKNLGTTLNKNARLYETITSIFNFDNKQNATFWKFENWKIQLKNSEAARRSISVFFFQSAITSNNFRNIFFLAEPGAHYFWKLVCWNDTQCRLAPGYLNPDSENHFLKLEVKCKWSAISEKDNSMLCTLLYLFLSENARFQKSEDGYGPPAPIQSCFAGSKICYFWKGILSVLVIFPFKRVNSKRSLQKYSNTVLLLNWGICYCFSRNW